MNGCYRLGLITYSLACTRKVVRVGTTIYSDER